MLTGKFSTDWSPYLNFIAQFAIRRKLYFGNKKSVTASSAETYISRKIENHIYNANNLGNVLAAQRFRWSELLGCAEKAGNATIIFYYLNLTLQAAHFLFTSDPGKSVKTRTPLQRKYC